jgi:hypothetical protein
MKKICLKIKTKIKPMKKTLSFTTLMEDFVSTDNLITYNENIWVKF